MKQAAFTLQITSLPSVSDLIDVIGDGTTGVAEVVEVNDLSENNWEIKIRVVFLEPFTNAEYVVIPEGFAGIQSDKHPAFYDARLEWNTVSSEVERQNWAIIGY